MPHGRTLAIAALLVAALAPTASQARTPPPKLTGLRCVPATRAVCHPRPQVMIGKQVQLRGTGFKAGMRVSFRWSKGALATKLRRSPTGWVARVPPGTKAGTISVRVTDRAGRRSRVIRLIVLPVPATAPAPGGPLPAPFAGNGMWIWQLPKSEGGDVNAIAARARAAGISTVFVKSSDGPDDAWAQFNPTLVQALHAYGLHVCAWQFVYGADPLGEAAQGASAVAAGADCLVIDAESRYEGRYAQAQQYVAALRAAVGPAYPIGLTSFPYVDYHPGLPYSVFLAPGAAQVNLPQVYWKDIGGSVDAVSARTWAHNRIFGVPIAPLGQTYQSPAPEEIQRFRQVWAAYGAGGLSWWSWQATGASTWAALGPASRSRRAAGGPGMAGARQGLQGRRGRLAAGAPGRLLARRPRRRRVRHVDAAGADGPADLARPARERRDGSRDLAGGARPAGAAGGLGVARLGCAGGGGRGPARPGLRAPARPARRDPSRGAAALRGELRPPAP